MRNQLKLLPLVMTCFITACAVGPNYKPPLVNVPFKYKEAKNKSVIAPIGKKSSQKKWKLAQPQDYCSRGEWWRIFNNSELNGLENRLNTSNQSIINAYENYKQAKALVDEARANYFPNMTGSLNLTRQKSGGGSSSFISTSNGVTSTGTAATGATVTSASSSSITSSHSLILDATWEPDIWGLVRRTVEASAAGAQASAALYASTRLSSQASLAQFYFELRGLDDVQKVLDKSVQEDKKSLQLTKNQYAVGVAAKANIVQAESVLEAAQALAINNGILRAQYEHAIAVLIGIPPAELTLKPYALEVEPPSIPMQVPSALLERRPDVSEAERLIKQANANIGVAIAAYFPTLTLNGSASTTLGSLGQLFAVPALNWALGAQVADTIIDGGLRNATVRAARAAYLASVANYRQTVLAAFEDVEDNLVSLRILNEQIIVERQAVKSAEVALNLVLNQYKSGIVPYSSVITAQLTVLKRSTKCGKR